MTAADRALANAKAALVAWPARLRNLVEKLNELAEYQAGLADRACDANADLSVERHRGAAEACRTASRLVNEARVGGTNA